ncbi:MAG: CDP-alcohol phosphatidyltransferase family protein [Gammaproteobacteria bacterium]|nr:MAG: CDP-alcohol phosphatidyltransferase family protein [Gammaproteobacteria bacterium]RLA60764.1 MAG: CDP-alcohol phosphatidyltransferase family protein [Gammaproteobacteria bacterium]
MLQYLPNTLTLSRLLLAVPLGLLIFRGDYAWALGISLLAGVTDALDGFFARRLQVFSRWGAALDPIADKTLITVAFLSFAQVELIPWYLALAVISRDVIIVIGATCYYKLIGPFEFSATGLSKANMFVQICFCLLVLLAQVITAIPHMAITVGSAAVLFIATASGFDYVMSWTIKAIQSRQKKE